MLGTCSDGRKKKKIGRGEAKKEKTRGGGWVEKKNLGEKRRGNIGKCQ